MRPAVVWFNRHLSNTWEMLELLRRETRPGEFRVIGTHPRPNYRGQLHVEYFEPEPIGLSDDDYVRYCLDFAGRHGVTLFLPGRKVLPVVRAREQFAAIGTRVATAADAETLAILNDKGRFYRELAGDGFALPDYEVVNDLAGFDAAWERLRPRHNRLCYKPAVSVFGLGFHIVIDRGPGPERADASTYRISLDKARRTLAAKGRFRDLMLMEYLTGPERSVDCLARGGRLVRCVVRRKEAGGQVLEDNPAVQEVVRRLTARFGLSCLFNAQFRDARGVPYLLEINARMSGGLPFAAQSGLNLLLWAIRLELGTAAPDEVPLPETGVWVPQPQLARSV